MQIHILSFINHHRLLHGGGIDPPSPPFVQGGGLDPPSYTLLTYGRKDFYPLIMLFIVITEVYAISLYTVPAYIFLLNISCLSQQLVLRYTDSGKYQIRELHICIPLIVIGIYISIVSIPDFMLRDIYMSVSVILLIRHIYSWFISIYSYLYTICCDMRGVAHAILLILLYTLCIPHIHPCVLYSTHCIDWYCFLLSHVSTIHDTPCNIPCNILWYTQHMCCIYVLCYCIASLLPRTHEYHNILHSKCCYTVIYHFLCSVCVYLRFILQGEYSNYTCYKCIPLMIYSYHSI